MHIENVCMYTHAHTHITCKCTHTFTYVRGRCRACWHPGSRSKTYVHACMHTYMHTYTHACIHTHMHTYIHTHMHTYTHAYIHTCIHTYMHIHTHMKAHIYLHKCTHILYYLHSKHSYTHFSDAHAYIQRSRACLAQGVLIRIPSPPTQRAGSTPSTAAKCRGNPCVCV